MKSSPWSWRFSLRLRSDQVKRMDTLYVHALTRATPQAPPSNAAVRGRSVVGIEPAAGSGHLPDHGDLVAPHQAAAGDLAIGISLALNAPGPSKVKHLEPPVAYGPSAAKAAQGTRYGKVRDSGRGRAQVAPLRRQRRGPINGGNPLAGSNTPNRR